MILKNSLFIISLIFVLCIGCKDRHGVVKAHIGHAEIEIDTIMIFDLEGISTEGTNATVKYVKNRINSAEIIIYSGSGKVELIMSFKKDSIETKETVYRYEVPISEVGWKSDMYEESNSSYWINYNGKLIRGGENRKANIWHDFKEKIPFTLVE